MVVPLRRSKEPDFPLAERIATQGCILRSLVGSTVHGLENPGTDDRDEMGVCVEPREYVVGLRRFEHWVYRTQDEGVSSGPGDLDLTIYGLRKFCRLAMKGSPTSLLILFTDGDDVLVRTELGERLQALAPTFITKRTARAFLGYLDAQRRGLLGTRHATRTRELSPTHGYDTKYAMHALRIGHQGLELITTGRISLPIAEPTRSHLLAVRRGEVALPDVLTALHDVSAKLETATLAARVPEEPDRDVIDAYLLEAYENHWSHGQ